MNLMDGDLFADAPGEGWPTRPVSPAVAAFIDLMTAALESVQWRDELIAGVADPELTRFWQRFDALTPAQQENFAAPIPRGAVCIRSHSDQNDPLRVVHRER
jgi:hypothetical protein